MTIMIKKKLDHYLVSIDYLWTLKNRPKLQIIDKNTKPTRKNKKSFGESTFNKNPCRTPNFDFSPIIC